MAVKAPSDCNLTESLWVSILSVTDLQMHEGMLSLQLVKAVSQCHTLSTLIFHQPLLTWPVFYLDTSRDFIPILYVNFKLKANMVAHQVILPPHSSKVTILLFSGVSNFVCLCVFPLGPLVSCHHLTHASRWTGYCKLPLCVNVCKCCTKMAWHPIQGVFLPHVQCSQHILWIHSCPYQDKRYWRGIN